MEMYPKDKDFEKTQAKYLEIKESRPCEFCFKPGYGYYIRLLCSSDPAPDSVTLMDGIVYEWKGPNRTVSYEYPLDES